MMEFLSKHKLKIAIIFAMLIVMSMSYSNGYADGCADTLGNQVVILSGETSA